MKLVKILGVACLMMITFLVLTVPAMATFKVKPATSCSNSLASNGSEDGLYVKNSGGGNHAYYFQFSIDGYTCIDGYTKVLTALAGPQGPIGPQGIQGIQGIQGVKGDKGDQGIQGPVGPGGEGSIGPIGPQGLKGDKGDKGDTGATGAQGIQGEPNGDIMTIVCNIDDLNTTVPERWLPCTRDGLRIVPPEIEGWEVIRSWNGEPLFAVALSAHIYFYLPIENPEAHQ